MNYKINTKLIFQNTKNQIIIYNPKDSLLFTLNSTASIICKSIKKKLTIAEISKKLAFTYEIPQEQALNDVNSCIKDLVDKEILLSTENRREKPSV